ncbi:MAG: YceI family protein [Bdellovibrio sp.]
MKFILSALVLMASFAASAEVYKIDTKESSVAWKGMKKTGSSHDGHIAVKEGTVTLGKAGEIEKGDVVIDMKTISNSDLKDSPDYQKKLVGHLSNEDFFNVTKYPTSTFKITKVTPKAVAGKAAKKADKKDKSAAQPLEQEVTVTGEFTMIGQTHPIEFPAKIVNNQGVLTGEALVKIDRTKWGLKYGSGNFFKELTADKIITDEFELTLKLVAKK